MTLQVDELLAAKTPDEAAWETADVIYFALVAANSKGATLEDVDRHLDTRALAVKRRAGNAKPGY